MSVAETARRLPGSAKILVQRKIPHAIAEGVGENRRGAVVVALVAGTAIYGLGLGVSIAAEAINDQKLVSDNAPKSDIAGKMEIGEQVVFVPEDDLKATYLYKGDIGVLFSESFRPSKSIKGRLEDMRRAENLILWRDIEQINGVSVKGAKVIRLSNPLITFADSGENAGFGEWLKRVDLLKFKAKIRMASGFEERFLYIPFGTGESLDFVSVYQHEEGRLAVRIINGRYYYLGSPFEKKKEIPGEVGLVTVLSRFH